MGMDPFNFSDSLLGVLAQRLARRLCVKCKETYHPDQQEFDDLMMIYDRQWFQEHRMRPYSPDFTLMRRVGCDACNGSGYKGRIAIHELLANTDSIKQLIRRRAEMDELRKTAITEGMKTLQMDGVEKVFQGLTDRDELLRVCRLENSGG
jgi:type II secretory ATPase GspE/PulE/Tfp pilus assembly ATPase PilB-like protein